MFSQKRAEVIINCDTFIDLYDKCDVGCEVCKFNVNIKDISQNTIDFNKYKNNKVLFCYKTDPYVRDDLELVEKIIKKLHKNNCKIVFLTRKAELLLNQLSIFNENDFVGVSISENCTKNSSIDDIIKVLKTANELGIKTWISLEPVITAEFANNIVNKIGKYADFIRVGKDDLIDYNWDEVKNNIKTAKNVYVKD